jgi:hypothetical protein
MEGEDAVHVCFIDLRLSGPDPAAYLRFSTCKCLRIDVGLAEPASASQYIIRTRRALGQILHDTYVPASWRGKAYR